MSKLLLSVTSNKAEWPPKISQRKLHIAGVREVGAKEGSTEGG